MNCKYIDNNGDCEEPDNFYPLTAFDEDGIVGHLILRYIGAEKKEMRIGFVIVDDTKRGKGYGREMIRLALKYAFDLFKAERATLGVFDNNPAAYRCYKAAGFREYSEREVSLLGENWRCIDMECRSED
jgi:RimJ/RimL family protein N-acetyltransferase